MVTSNVSKAPSGDRRVRRTHAALQRALIELVDHQDLPRISVADVAERAEVSRSTFYDHYRDVHELAEAACTAMIDDMVASLPSPGQRFSGPQPGPIEALQDFFAHFAEHANLYRSVLGPQGSARIIDHIRRLTTAAIYLGTHQADSCDHVTLAASDIPQDVTAAFAAAGFVGVAIDWLQRGCPHAPAEMATRTLPLFTALYGEEMLPPS
ncbi:TetR/AcrR family transcriptional regulator [Mycobacterium sp.]|uniref:TetR/AcrR family transcriptional regulator n=1 Tax=Mycobacterium sp. TaxID=1785 RepID=UPI002D4E98C2|nr:TetR/AcrR family transcriptional regulator [Mycobacterium sp.]HZA12371.1 TetR/AcrR family transcriptional regulator [Mycobacterium sp.]